MTFTQPMITEILSSDTRAATQTHQERLDIQPPARHAALWLRGNFSVKGIAYSSKEPSRRLGNHALPYPGSRSAPSGLPPFALLDNRHMPRRIARCCAIKPRIVRHLDLAAEGAEAGALVEGDGGGMVEGAGVQPDAVEAA